MNSLLLAVALMASPAMKSDPASVDAGGICTVFDQHYDTADGGFEVCVEVVTRAEEYGVDPFFAAVMAWKESRFRRRVAGDGGYSWGPFQVSMLYHCEPPEERWLRFRTARERAKECDLIGEALAWMAKLKQVPRSRRTQVLTRYESGPFRVPRNQRLLYHVAAEFKGGPVPPEAAHKSAWRVLKQVRRARRLYRKLYQG